MNGTNESIEAPSLDTSAEPGRRHWISLWLVLGVQTLNAFNDKVAQYALIALSAVFFRMSFGKGIRPSGIAGAVVAICDICSHRRVVFGPIFETHHHSCLSVCANRDSVVDRVGAEV